MERRIREFIRNDPGFRGRCCVPGLFCGLPVSAPEPRASSTGWYGSVPGYRSVDRRSRARKTIRQLVASRETPNPRSGRPFPMWQNRGLAWKSDLFGTPSVSSRSASFPPRPRKNAVYYKEETLAKPEVVDLRSATPSNCMRRRGKILTMYAHFGILGKRRISHLKW